MSGGSGSPARQALGKPLARARALSSRFRRLDTAVRTCRRRGSLACRSVCRAQLLIRRPASRPSRVDVMPDCAPFPPAQRLAIARQAGTVRLRPRNLALRQIGGSTLRRRHPHSASLRTAHSSHVLRDTPAREGEVLTVPQDGTEDASSARRRRRPDVARDSGRRRGIDGAA